MLTSQNGFGFLFYGFWLASCSRGRRGRQPLLSPDVPAMVAYGNLSDLRANEVYPRKAGGVFSFFSSASNRKSRLRSSDLQEVTEFQEQDVNQECGLPAFSPVFTAICQLALKQMGPFWPEVNVDEGSIEPFLETVLPPQL